MNLHKLIRETQKALKDAKNTETKNKTGSITNFKQKRAESINTVLKGYIKQILEATKHDHITGIITQPLNHRTDPDTIQKVLEKLSAHIAKEEPETPRIKLTRLPADIQDEITADIQELERCMKATCHRSAVIICGRILETALHRKYYEETGTDLLEKSPGIGLGNIIAKLTEKGVKLDPGLPNQIHLINQVRIFSVHKKRQPFTPTKQQAEAIILYTLDVVNKILSASSPSETAQQS